MGGRFQPRRQLGLGPVVGQRLSISRLLRPPSPDRPKKAALGLGVRKRVGDGTASQGTEAPGEGATCTSHPPKHLPAPALRGLA